MGLRERQSTIDLFKRQYQKQLFKQFDNGITYTLKIVENGVKVDLTNYTIVAFFETPSGQVIQKNTAKQNVNGIVTVELDNNILAEQGFVKAEFNFLEGTAPNQKVVTSFVMMLEVEPSIDRNQAVTKQPQWDILTSFQTTLDDAIKKAEQDIQTAIDSIPPPGKWIVGNTQPPNQTTPANANIGDFYINANTGEFWEKTNATTWVRRGDLQIQGAKGDKGDKGTVWHTSNTTPVNTAGAIGDFHLNTTNGQYWEKTATNVWTARGSLRGPTGPTGVAGPKGATGPRGANGTNGTNGKDGSVWFTGTGNPTANNTQNSKDGDFYLDSSNGNVWKKTGTSWGASYVANIRGPQGPQGAGGTGGGAGGVGPQGPTGPTGPMGPQGPAGQDGKDGTVWFNGTTAPTTTNTTGSVENDYYLNTTNGTVYKKNAQGTWDAQPGSLRGPAGTGGTTADIPQWYFGRVAPTDASMTTTLANAKNGDLYINWAQDTPQPGTASLIYRYNGTTWSAVGRGYYHPSTHPASMITFTGTNQAKTLQQLIDTGGTIGGPTTIQGPLTVPTNVTTGRLKGNTASGGENSIYLGADANSTRISSAGGVLSLYTTPHTTATAQSNGLSINGTGQATFSGSGTGVKHTLANNGNLTSTGIITAGTGLRATSGGVIATAGNISANNGNVTASGNIQAGGTGNIGGTLTTGNSITATTGNITASGGDIVSSNVLYGNVIRGRATNATQTNDRIGVGTGNCRMDTTSGLFRLLTSALGGNDYGVRIYPDGKTSVVVNNVERHQFNTDGTKTGGTMEIDGTVYGMSPTDSPQTLIEYIEFDVNINGEQVVKLDEIYAKMISKYTVVSTNHNIELVSKEPTQFTVKGIGLTDFIIKGQRKGADEYYRIMGGIEHGTTEG